jgi:hypothetical protein
MRQKRRTGSRLGGNAETGNESDRGNRERSSGKVRATHVVS